jgi:hypothetical protein
VGEPEVLRTAVIGLSRLRTLTFCPSGYRSWDDARAMQEAGMVLGGHAHQHPPLATLSAATLAWDVRIHQQFM